jgi:hypothetical protein
MGWSPPRRDWPRYLVLVISLALTVVLVVGALRAKYLAEFHFEPGPSTDLALTDYQRVVEVPVTGVPNIDVRMQSASWKAEDLHLWIKPQAEPKGFDNGAGQQVGSDQIHWVASFGSPIWPMHENTTYTYSVVGPHNDVEAFGEIRANVFKIADWSFAIVSMVVSTLASFIQILSLCLMRSDDHAPSNPAARPRDGAR